MGKAAKSSRKGKKAWRANIPTDDVEEFFQKSTKDALSGGSLAAVPSDSLFFVDKSTTDDVSVKRKIEKHREKVLRVDSSLQSNPFVKPIPSSTLKKCQKKQAVPKPKVESKDASEDNKDQASNLGDLWDDEGEDNLDQAKMKKPSLIPAVEVDPLGCSFNPDFEAHQNSLACAVAEEMQKIYKDELGPQRVPLTVPGEVVDEENMYFLDADDGNDDEDLDEKLDENGDITTDIRLSKRKPVTRVELNRRIRRKERLKVEADAKKLKSVSKQIDSLPDILKEIAKEDEEKQRKHVRRAVAKQERLKSGPPRLGKRKFEPAPSQVLLSEDISGSLRKLKGCCTLARDRFKSFEKRGLIVPSAKRRRK